MCACARSARACVGAEETSRCDRLRSGQLGKPFPEHLAVYYTIKMVSSIEILHEAQVLHGDLKPDNWLVVPGCSSSVLRSSNKPEKARFRYQTGDLSLIDFGRAIDLAFFPQGTTFIGDCHTKGFQTTEMISNKPWTKQIDTFGICATAHCMLFGDYMDVVCQQTRCGAKRWGIKKTFKRYWDVTLWSELFDSLLNVKSCVEQPSLPLLRQKLEAYFSNTPQHEQVGGSTRCREPAPHFLILVLFCRCTRYRSCTSCWATKSASSPRRRFDT